MKKLLPLLSSIVLLTSVIMLSCDKEEPAQPKTTNVAAKGSRRSDKTPPTVVITSPANGDTLPLNTPYTISADVTDNLRIVSVGIIVNYPNPFNPTELIPSQAVTLYSAPWQTTFVTPNQPCNVTIIVFASDGTQITQKNIYLTCA